MEKNMVETSDMVTSGTPLVFPDAEIIVYAAPKAACSSVKYTLAESYSEGSQKGKKAVKKARRLSLHKLKRNDKEYGYLKIGFCRDPHDKIVSIYVDKLMKRPRVKQQLVELGFYRNMPFGEYVALVASIPDERVEKHLRSQYLLLFRDGAPDVLVKFEDIEEGWKKVQRIFRERGGREIAPLMRLNTSDGIEKPVMTREMRKMISKRYETDIRLLGY
jgi:hypothetical protein